MIACPVLSVGMNEVLSSLDFSRRKDSDTTQEEALLGYDLEARRVSHETSRREMWPKDCRVREEAKKRDKL